MKETLTDAVSAYNLGQVPYDLQAGRRWTHKRGYVDVPAASKSTIHAVAARIRQVADYFEANPHQRVKGTLVDGHKVCAIGAVRHSRLIGLKWEPTASRNCNAQLTMAVMESMNVVDVNDSGVPAEQFLSYTRFCADVLDAYAVSRDWAASVNKQPLAKRLKINIPTPVSA